MDVRCEVMVIEDDQPNIGLIYRTPIYTGEKITLNYSIRRHVVNTLQGHVEVNVQSVPTFGVDESIGIAKLELSRLKAGRTETVVLAVNGVEIETECELLKAV